MNRSARASLAKAVRSAGRRVLLPPAGQVDRRAGRRQPALDAGGEVEHQVGLGGLPLGVAGVVAAVAGIDDDPAADQVRAAVDERRALPEQLRAATGDLPAELPQRAQRGRAARAVGGQAVVALEGAQADLGLRTEDAVHRAGVVAELVQPVLQVDDVVPADRTFRVVPEQPVAERPARLVERAVGLVADPAVHRQAADLLEVADGELGGRIELGRLERGGVHGRPVDRRRCPAGSRRSGMVCERAVSAAATVPVSTPRRPRLRSAARTSATAGPRSPSLRICIRLSVPIVCSIVVPVGCRGPSGSQERERAHPSGWTNGPVQASSG